MDGKDYVENDSPTQQWKMDLLQMKSNYGVINASHVNHQESIFKNREVGLNNHTDSYVKIRNNGVIDIFASPSVGIRVDPRNESINLIAQKLSINTQNFDLQTNPVYFRFNSRPLDIDKLEVRNKKQGSMYSDRFIEAFQELNL